MAKTLIDVDPELVDRARTVLHTATKKDTVNAALREVIRRDMVEDYLDHLRSDPYRDLRDPEVERGMWPVEGPASGSR